MKIKIPTHKESLELLEKYEIKKEILEHSKLVNKIAMFLGKKLREKGEMINLELLDAASLLHDIGKIRSNKTGKSHTEEGRDILLKEGYPEIAELIPKHRIDKIYYENLNTWEEKLIYYGDRRAGTKIMPVDERIKDMLTRHPSLEKDIPKFKPRIKELEGEIFNILDINKDLKEIKENQND